MNCNDQILVKLLSYDNLNVFMHCSGRAKLSVVENYCSTIFHCMSMPQFIYPDCSVDGYLGFSILRLWWIMLLWMYFTNFLFFWGGFTHTHTHTFLLTLCLDWIYIFECVDFGTLFSKWLYQISLLVMYENSINSNLRWALNLNCGVLKFRIWVITLFGVLCMVNDT